MNQCTIYFLKTEVFPEREGKIFSVEKGIIIFSELVDCRCNKLSLYFYILPLSKNTFEFKMSIVPEQILQDMVNAIVQEVHPEKIILFGSQVNGNVHQDSDVDLLIIEQDPFGKQRSRWKELSKIRKSLWSFDYAVDILVSSIEEMNKWKNSINHIISHILREGRVLYERS